LYSGKFDDVVPPENSKQFAVAAGLPASHHIEMEADHYSGIFQLPTVLKHIAFIATSGVAVEADDAKLQPGFRWLFDGKTLDGWEGNLDYFRVEDGAIVAGTLEKEIPHNEFLCTKESFSDFELVFEAKLRGVGDNAGVQFRSKRVPDSTEVSGYQCDVGTAWNRSVWGCLYDESRRNKILADAPADKAAEWTNKGEWNELRVVAKGNKIKLYLNGNLSVDYTEEDLNIARSGIIGLQIHSGPPSEALYRNIQIRAIKEDE
jgi:hypothetical protein